jgi:hypothetical protein
MERHSESLLLFLFHGTEFRVFSLPRNGSQRNSESLHLFLNKIFVYAQNAHFILRVYEIKSFSYILQLSRSIEL